MKGQPIGENETSSRVVRQLGIPWPLYFFPFGRGCGFGAEWVGTLKAAAASIFHGYGLRLFARRPGVGVFIESGWEDYFEPLFETSYSPVTRWIEAICRRIPVSVRSTFAKTVPLGLRFSVPLSWGATTSVLRCGFTGDWWSDMERLSGVMWRFNERTQTAVNVLLAECQVPDGYLAVHVRRGDKGLERAAPSFERYVDAVSGLNLDDLPLVLIGDDYAALAELASVYFTGRVALMGAGRMSGFHERHFNELDPKSRYEANCRFLADMSLMKNAVAFVGDGDSNVFYMAQYLRGNRETYAV